MRRSHSFLTTEAHEEADQQNLYNTIPVGAMGDWDFRISDLVKNPDGTDI